MIIDPMGEVLAAGSQGETILTAEVRAEVVAETRRKLPFLPDRR
jgi:predicted amidohydrolase